MSQKILTFDRYIESESNLLLESSSLGTISKLLAFFLKEKSGGVSLIIDTKINRLDLEKELEAFEAKLAMLEKTLMDQKVRCRAVELGISLDLIFESNQKDSNLDISLEAERKGNVLSINICHYTSSYIIIHHHT